MILANSLEPDQARHFGPDLDPNCLTLWWYSCKNLLKTIILKKNQWMTKEHVRLPSMQRGNPGIYFPGQLVISGSDEACYQKVKDKVFLGGFYWKFVISLTSPWKYLMWHSLKASPQDCSNEYPQHKFSMRNASCLELGCGAYCISASTLFPANIFCLENVVCLLSLLAYNQNHFRLVFTLWTLIRLLLLREQSDQGPYCL